MNQEQRKKIWSETISQKKIALLVNTKFELQKNISPLLKMYENQATMDLYKDLFELFNTIIVREANYLAEKCLR